MPSLAARLEAGGMSTLFTLAEQIKGIGAYWWTGVAGIGALQASRLVDWLRLYEESIGVRLGASGKESATRRAYHKEAERLLLWAILECGKPLSSLTVEDDSLRDVPGGAARCLVRAAT